MVLTPTPRADACAYGEGPEEIRDWGRARALASEAALGELVRSSGRASVEGFLAPLDRILVDMRNQDCHGTLLFLAHPDASVRAAGREVSDLAAAFFRGFHQNRSVRDRLRDIDLDGADVATRRAVEWLLREMRRHGVELSEAERARLTSLDLEIEREVARFYENLRNGERSIDLAPEELEGLSPSYRGAHLPGPDGRVRITTRSGEAMPVMERAASPEVRLRLHRALGRRAFPENAPVIERIRTLRHDYARMLGYPHYAAYALETGMLPTPKDVTDLLDRIAPTLLAAAERERSRLLEEKRRDDPGAQRVEAWDEAYLLRRGRREATGEDPDRWRRALTYGRVRDQLFALSEDLFGLTFRREVGADVWHPTVEAYEILRGAERVGRCYLDPVSREGRSGGGAMFPVRPGLAGRQVPEGALLMPLLDATDAGEGAGIVYPKVVGFFHEFGHLVHHVLSGGARWLPNVTLEGLEWDFVEVPSKIFEALARDPEVLSRIARDPDTGGPFAREELDRHLAAQLTGRASERLHGLALAHASLGITSEVPPSTEIGQILREAVRRYEGRPLDPEVHPETAWSHLMGYAARYYTYLWGELIAADLLTRFRAGGGLTDPEVGRRFAEEVLAPGASRRASESIREFLGRELSDAAFLAAVGG